MANMVLVDLIRKAGKDIDDRFPGLRESNGNEWSRKVSYLAWTRDNKCGGKKAGRDNPRSMDTFGILHMEVDIPEGEAVRAPFDAVSIIRNNPPGGNEWRSQPIISDNLTDQYWIRPEPVVIGGPVAPPVEPPPSKPPVVNPPPVVTPPTDVEWFKMNLADVLAHVECMRDKLRTMIEKL